MYDVQKCKSAISHAILNVNMNSLHSESGQSGLRKGTVLQIRIDIIKILKY